MAGPISFPGQGRVKISELFGVVDPHHLGWDPEPDNLTIRQTNEKTKTTQTEK